MSTNTKEIGFEAFIENFLVTQAGYLKRLASDYDRETCLDPEMFWRFVSSTQPKQSNKLIGLHGLDRAREKLLAEIVRVTEKYGLLEILREGVTLDGILFRFAHFKPNTDFNPENLELYRGNVFSVIRQLKYSGRNENSIDMVLFLNGFPIATVELKNQLTGQSVEHGIRQYRTDRDPKERLLAFKRCLVHFAIDTEQAYMATELKGEKTYFLPFNRWNDGSAGNSAIAGKYKTSYMWEDVFTPDTLLELIGRFICLQKEEKTLEGGKKEKTERLVFPRYHQLDAVRKLVADAQENGSGRNYLIEHSAGSGKSNTIAWTAHRLADLHDASNGKVFDSVIIITDRRVLDKQLRETVSQFEQVRGVVKPITEGSAELRTALQDGEKIIITTLQKFPFIADEMGTIPGRKFAVIIDEAHSSQSGESGRAVNDVLSAGSGEDEETVLERAFRSDSAFPEEDGEDWLVKQMKNRSRKNPNVSYFAFTATPKQKTLELFGQMRSDGSFVPFSVYSMKQAIEEGFILDVLKNYTTYDMFFSLHKSAENDPKYSKSLATRVLVNAVEKSEHAIGKKSQIIVDYFERHVKSGIGGKAKAMVVTKSRLHAVRYKIAIDKYLREQGLSHRTLVAFSGTVKDSGMEYTEANMNGIPESQTKEEFKKDDCKFLIVAEKYQTWFDQPLLGFSAVDKKLGGVNAVQTLSRLNRTHPDKGETFVLDFVNETGDIKEAFQPYYTTTVLSEATEPGILYDLRRDILGHKLFGEPQIAEFADMWHRGVTPAELNSFLDVLMKRWKELNEDEKTESEEQAECRVQISDYVRKYAFVSQIIDFTDADLEAMYVFLRFYKKKLPMSSNPLPTELLDLVNLESIKVPKRSQTSIVLDNETGKLDPMGAGGRGEKEDDTESLSKILSDVNERFGTTFSEEDRIMLNTLSARLLKNEALVGAMNNNVSEDAVRVKFDELFTKELVSMFRSNFDLFQKIDKNIELKDFVNGKMYEFIHRQVKASGK